MPEKHVFEYAVIRLVPRVEREEFMNVGVILFSRNLRYLKAKVMLNREKFLTFNSELDIYDVEANLSAIENIAEGLKSGGPIALMDDASRFRWLTATRSTVIQPSKVHPGLCSDADDSLEKIFDEMVK